MTRPSVLFVDDEPHVTQALKRTLRREPYKLYSADTAAAGLELLDNESIEIVVSDEKMPGMSGCEFLAEVRRRHPATIRMMLTGEASMEAAIRAINEGEIYRFFTKPCNPADLKATLRQAVLQHQLVRQSHKLLEKYREQQRAMEEIERSNPGLLSVDCDSQGAILVSGVDDDMQDLLAEIDEIYGEAKAS